jgi:hypothetical protein
MKNTYIIVLYIFDLRTDTCCAPQYDIDLDLFNSSIHTAGQDAIGF